MATYILQKDTPSNKCGAEFSYDPHGAVIGFYQLIYKNIDNQIFLKRKYEKFYPLLNKIKAA